MDFYIDFLGCLIFHVVAYELSDLILYRLLLLSSNEVGIFVDKGTHMCTSKGGKRQHVLPMLSLHFSE